jgi:hypothetical protein
MPASVWKDIDLIDAKFANPLVRKRSGSSPEKAWLPCDIGATNANGDPRGSFTVPGSPDWSRLLLTPARFQYASRPWDDPANHRTAAAAKAFLKSPQTPADAPKPGDVLLDPFDAMVEEIETTTVNREEPGRFRRRHGSILTFGTDCLFRTEECVGESTGWSEAQEIRRNERPTGNRRPRVEPHTEAVTADILLQGHAADGTVMGSAPATVKTTDGTLRLPLTSLLQ